MELSLTELNFKNLSRELQNIIGVVKSLDKVAVISDSFVNDVSTKIFYRLRKNAIDWHNEKDLTKLLVECFSYIEKFTDIINNDIKSLKSWQHLRNETILSGYATCLLKSML